MKYVCFLPCFLRRLMCMQLIRRRPTVIMFHGNGGASSSTSTPTVTQEVRFKSGLPAREVHRALPIVRALDTPFLAPSQCHLKPPQCLFNNWR